jgi:hypothetical protein
MNELTKEKKNKLEKIFIYIRNNSKLIIIISLTLLFILFGYFYLESNKKKENIKISEKFFMAKILIEQNKKKESEIILNEIIEGGHKFYAPLSLYLIIDQKITTKENEIIKLFDKILSIKKIDKEILNLIKIKKALYLMNNSSEEKILELLNPIINSKSEWRPQAIEILYEYFLSKGEDVKSQEYYQLLQTTNN